MEASREKAGAIASFACAVLTVGGMGVGVGIMQAMGVASGVEVASASVEALRAARPLLIAAELLKIATGLAVVVAVSATRRRWHVGRATSALGYLAAVLVMAAGVVGLFALLSFSAASSHLGPVVGLLGLLSLPVTGLWAAVATWRGGARPRGLKIAGLLLAVSGVSTLLFPPFGFLFGVASLLWWILLGLTLRKAPDSRACA